MKRINAIASVMSGGLVCLIGILMLVEFVSRNLEEPVPWVIEAAIFSLVLMVYFGLSQCEQERFHVKADVLIVRFPLKLKHVANLFDYFVALLTLVVVCYATGAEALFSTMVQEAEAAAVTVPIYPMKIVLFIGCVFYFVQLLLNTIEEFGELGRGENWNPS